MLSLLQKRQSGCNISDLNAIHAAVGTATAPKPRVPFTERVWYRLPNAKKPVPTLGANLSETGIFIQTTDPPQVGSHIGLQFFVNGNETPVEAVAQVVWVKPFEPINIDGLLPGMGVKFTNIKDDNVVSIREFVQHNLRSSHRKKSEHPETESTAPKEAVADYLSLEQPMVLQLTGDHQPIFGYSTQVHKKELRFCTDFIPNESVANGLENKRTPQKLRGCIGIPVEIDQIERQRDGSADPKQLSMSLAFAELRDELVKVRPRLNTVPIANIKDIEDKQPKARINTPPKAVPAPNYMLAVVVSLALFVLGLVIGSFL